MVESLGPSFCELNVTVGEKLRLGRESEADFDPGIGW